MAAAGQGREESAQGCLPKRLLGCPDEALPEARRGSQGVCEKSQGPHLPAKSVQAHHSPVVRAERPHRIRQDFLQGEQDLLIEATYKVPISPVGATLSQGNEAERTGSCTCTAHQVGNKAAEPGPEG